MYIKGGPHTLNCKTKIDCKYPQSWDHNKPYNGRNKRLYKSKDGPQFGREPASRNNLKQMHSYHLAMNISILSELISLDHLFLLYLFFIYSTTHSPFYVPPSPLGTHFRKS